MEPKSKNVQDFDLSGAVQDVLLSNQYESMPTDVC